MRYLETLPAPDTSFDPDPIKNFFKPSSWLPTLLSAIPRDVSPYFKNPEFKEEQEWRLVVTVRPRNRQDRKQTQDIPMDEIATIHFRNGEYSLVPYIEFPVVLDDEPLPLSKVVVGPTPLPANALAAAIQFLRPENAAGRKIVCDKTNITSSGVPFRRV